MRTTLTLILALFLQIATATAQTAETSSSSSQTPATLPEAPRALPTYLGDPSETYLFNAGVFCGAGASTSPTATKPTVGCGAGMSLLPLPVFFEVGVMGPQANRSYLSGYISIDGRVPLAPTSTKYLPMAIFGYSRLFETGHALDYGLALALPRFKDPDSTKSLRIELRDYWTFASPAQHNVMLRIGWMSQVSD
jgi:hypothetical protein